MTFVELERGVVEQGAGNATLAREHYQRAKAMQEVRYKQDSRPSELWTLGYLAALLGQREQALAQVALAIREDSAEKQYDPFLAECIDKDSMAELQATLGNAGEAVAALDWLLARPAGNDESVALLKIDPTWDPIRNDPRFQALLTKYSQPVPASAANSASTAPVATESSHD